MTDRPRRFLRVLAAMVAWLALGIAVARAQQPSAQVAAGTGDVLYGALVLATKSEQPRPTPKALEPQVENLKKIFGYNDFQLLGEKKKTMATGKEDWLVPSPQFILTVDTKNKIVGGYALALQLLEENRVVVSADVKLKRDRPLFIRGPFVGNGQILILLTVL